MGFGTNRRAGAGTIRRGLWRMAVTQNEKGGSDDPPFSLNNFWFRAVIAVQQRCCIRLFGRFLPKLRPP
jgi:hypothetical protein